MDGHEGEIGDKYNFEAIHSSSFKPELRHLASRAPVFRTSPVGNYLDPVIPIGKTRFRLLDKENKPLAGKQLRVSVIKDDEPVEERLVTTGPTGYATSDFRVATSDGAKVKVEPVVNGESVEDSARIIDVSKGQLGAEVIRINNNNDLMSSGVQNFNHWSFPTFPDIDDVINAPELFNPSVIEQNGTCALDFTASVETRQFYFNQIVRKGTPDLTMEDRKRITEPVSFDLEASRDSELTSVTREGPIQAASPTLGKLNVYKQSWTRIGHGIGQLLYSLALAPCEETKIAIIEWSREERGRRRERTQVSEQLEHELHRDRMIEESVEGAVGEVQKGHSSTSQGGGGLTGGLAGSIGKAAAGSLGISLGGSAAQSESYSEGHRQVTVDTLHNLQDSVVQRSSALRSRRSTVVTQSQQIENENIRTRIVRNRNRNHAMTVEYFQVLEHYNVETELSDQIDVLLVPYEVPTLLWEDVPPFHVFTNDARNFRQRFLELEERVTKRIGEFSDIDPDSERVAYKNLEQGVRTNLYRALDKVLPQSGTVSNVDQVAKEIAQTAWERLSKWAKNPLRVKINPGKNLHGDNFQQVVLSSINDLGGFGFPDPRKRSNLIRWIDQYAEDLQELVPPEHRDGIEALYRLVHTPEIYESENPTATASRWTIEMRQGMRPGLSIIAHTSDDQEVSLQHETDRKGSAISTFSSPPIDIQAVEKFEIVYAPEKAKTNVIRKVADEFGVVGETVEAIWDAFSGPAKEAAQDQVEKMKKYELKRLRIVGHTDPSKYLSGTKSYQLLEKSNIEETLTADNHAWDYRTTQPTNIDFDLTESRRYRDYTEVEELITHIKANRMSYLRALWLREDADRRALRLENYTHKYFPENENGREDEDGRDVPILQLIENQPVGVMGNSVAFPLQAQGQGQRIQEGDDESVNLLLEETQTKKLISLPTRGVYAETLLSKCNATEVRDVNRMIDPEQRCQASAPDITGISPGSRQSDMDLQPSQMPNPVVNIQNPPSAPQPTGTGGALDLLASGDIFRDMSLGSETVSAAQALAERAMQESGEAQQATLQELNRTLEKAEREAKSEAEKQAVERVKQGVKAAQQRTQQRANESFWNTDPTELRDREQVINESDMGNADKERARVRNYNAEGGSTDQQTESERSDDKAKREQGEKRTSQLISNLPTSPDEGTVLIARIFWHTRRPRPGQLTKDLEEEDENILDQILDDPNFPNQKWGFIGYTDARPDSQGKPDFNQELSERRAAAVFHYLSGVRMDENRIATGDVDTLTGVGANESDPSQPEHFPFDRRTEVYAKYKGSSNEQNGFFTREQLRDKTKTRIEALDSNPLGYSDDEMEIVLDRVMRAYAYGSMIQDMVDKGVINPNSGSSYGPCFEELEFRSEAPLNVLEGCVKKDENDLPFSSSGSDADLQFLIKTVKHQREMRSNPFYRAKYISEAEGKDQSSGFFIFATENEIPIEDLDWYPPAWEDLSDYRQQQLFEEGLDQDYISGRQHRQRMQPHINRLKDLKDEFMSWCSADQRQILKGE